MNKPTGRVIYIGIDVAIQAMGVAYVDTLNGEEVSKNTTHFGFKKDDELYPRRGDRYRLLFSELQNFLSHIQLHSGDEVVVIFEHYPFKGSGQICTMAELAGYLKGRLHSILDVNVFATVKTLEIHPTSLKKFVTGKGKAEKKEMMHACESKWGLAFKDHNECDAYCLIQAARVWNNPANTSKQRRDLLRVVKIF